jgi:hypothetical protein
MSFRTSSPLPRPSEASPTIVIPSSLEHRAKAGAHQVVVVDK